MSKQQKNGCEMNKAKNKSLRITIVYFLFSSIWIVLTDLLTQSLALSSVLINFSILKGLLFVAVTSCLIYKLTNSMLNELISSEDRRKDNELLFRTIYEESPIGIAISNNNEPEKDSKKNLIRMNLKFEEICGRTEKELMQIGWPKITHPDDLKEDLESFAQLQAGYINSYTMEKRLIRPEGSTVWVNMVVARLIHTNKHICMVQDITKRKMIENALLESERSKSVLLSNLPGLAYRCNYDCNMTMQFVSDGCFELTGYTPDQLIQNNFISFNNIIAPEYRGLLYDEWKHILPQKHSLNYEYEIITAEGQRKWVLELGQGIFDSNGNVEALEGIIIDITDRKENEIILKHLSEHDSFTGLYNRTYFINLLADDFKINKQVKRSIVLINLSTMYLLNLTYGFQYSQALIKKISSALSEYCTNNCQLFSTYANRFAFYLKEYRDKNELIAFSNTIAKKLKSILFIERINGGIGIYEIEDLETDVEQVLKNVLIASENALSNADHNFSYCFFDAEMELKLLRNEQIKSELSQIASGEKKENLYLQFQPIFDLHSHVISGFEALARLDSKKLGSISPLEFIPIAEATKLIIPIGKIIMQQALNFLNDLKVKGVHSINISINISVIQLIRPQFIPDLLELIDRMNINPTDITLELTESVFSEDYQEVNKILGELKEIGIHISIDDFGTGYSSLSRERELNIDYIKIDKSFIDNMINPVESITSDIISMAHKLGHSVIAEGVEYDFQKNFLEDSDCDKIQGYLISKPLSQEEAIIILEEQTLDKWSHV